MARQSLHTRAQRLAQQLHQEMLSRSLREDDLLMTEAQVAQRYGVSRGIVREAVSRLRALGVIKSRQAKGLLVGRPDPVALWAQTLPLAAQEPADRQGLAKLRYVLEVGAADLVVAGADAARIARLAQAAQAYEDASAAGHIEPINHADLAFHSELLAMTSTPFVAGMHRVLADFFAAETAHFTGPIPAGDMSVWHHHLIVQAVRQRDAEQLRALLRQHLRSLLDQP